MKQLLTAIFLLLPVFCLAQKQDYDNWIYEGDKSITEYTIPDGVRKIGLGAFSYCSNLQKIVIPNSVTEIDRYAFFYCDNLREISIGENVSVIPSSIFKYLKQLTKITVAPYNQFFSTIDNTLYNYDKTKLIFSPEANIKKGTFIIPQTVKEIGEDAFSRCQSLTSITIPKNVKVISNSAFDHCDNLEHVIIQDGVEIIEDAFNVCNSLTSIEIPGSVIKLEGFRFCQNLSSITINEGVENIEQAFGRCPNIKSVILPTSVKQIRFSFYGCDNMDEILVAPKNQSYSSLNGVLYNADTTEIILFPCNKNDIKIPNSVTKIAEGAFLRSHLTSITIPKNVKEIGRKAFQDCPNLSTITIPDNVKEIGEYAFYDCENLMSVTIENGVENIGDEAFSSCKNLISITIPSSVMEIGKSAFSNCENLVSVSIGNGVGKIGCNAFYQCKNLTSITIPSSVKEIGNSAFADCENLASVTIENGVEIIDEWAFDNCKNLTSITIPNSFKRIGSFAFLDCKNISSLIIENGVVEDYAFFIMNNLSSLKIGNGVEKIGKRNFVKCNNLTSITIPGSVKEIGWETFSDCKNLSSVTIENGVEKIDDFAFSHCTNLTSITIPGSIKEMGRAFANCDLTIIVFNGIDKINTLKTSNDRLQYNLVIIPDTFNTQNNFALINFHQLKNLEKPDQLDEISQYLFHKYKNADSVSALDSRDSNYALVNGVLFNADTTELIAYLDNKAKTYSIPQGVKKIKSEAFSSIDDYNLREIIIPESVTEIEENPFGYYDSEIILICNSAVPPTIYEAPKHLNNICVPFQYKDNYYHSNWNKMGRIESEQCIINAEDIYSKDLRGCKSIVITNPTNDNIINIANKVDSVFHAGHYYGELILEANDDFTEIPDSTFFNTPFHLICIHSIPEGVKRIGKAAFKNIFFSQLSIPSSITDIDDEAFYNSDCNIYLKGEAYTFGKSVFKSRWPDNTIQYDTSKPSIKAESIKLQVSDLNEYLQTLTKDSIYPITITNVTDSNIKALADLIVNSPFYLDVTLQGNLSSIPSGAFMNSKRLVSIALPFNIKSIGDSAFRYSISLTSIQLPNQLKTIGCNAFESCISLNDITIPNGVTQIGQYAFADCSRLYETIKLPKTMKEISRGLFSGCSTLKGISIPNTIKTIGAYAFQNCKNLSFPLIPPSVDAIGDYAFSFCKNLFIVGIYYNKKIIFGENVFYGSHANALIVPKSYQSQAFKQFADAAFVDEEYNGAIHYYKEYLKHNGSEKGYAYMRIGQSYMNLKHYYTAVEYYLKQAEKYYDKTYIEDNEKKNIYIELYRSILECYEKLDNLESIQYYAVKYLKLSESVLLTSNDYKIYYNALKRIGDFYYRIDDYKNANKYYEKLQVIGESLHYNDIEYLNDLILLSYVNFKLNDLVAAKEVLNVIDTIVNNDLMLHLGGDYHDEYDFYVTKLALGDLLKENINIDLWYLYKYQGPKNAQVIIDAYRLLHETGNDYEITYDVVEKATDTTSMYQSNYLSLLGDILYKKRNMIDSSFNCHSKSFAIELLKLKQNFSFMNTYQRQNYWQNHQNSFNNIVKISTKIPYNKDALGMAYNSLLISKGLLLASEENLSNIILKSKDEKIINDYFKLRYYRTCLDSLRKQTEKDSLLKLAGQLETDLLKQSSQFADVVNYMNIDWQKVQNSLGATDAAIEFFTEEDTVYALILKRDFDAPKLIKLSTCNFNNPYYSYEMYHSIWQPLERYLTPKSNIYFSPSGQLHTIAIENAMIDQNTSISDKYRIFRLSSTRNLALRRNTSKSKSALIYGNILYNANLDTIIQNDSQYRGFDRGWNHLDDKGEIDSINLHLSSNGYKTKIMTQYEATEKSFKALSNNNYSIIHLSTHGVYENSIDDPMQSSALIFAGANDLDIRPDTIDDGILSAQEISYLNLKNTDLVVLSACVSGLGEITSEGVFGLQRGFKKAGANTIVMSLRNVNNFYTKQFMLLFYHNLSKGIQKHDAFVEAQREFRHLYPDPKIQNEALFIMLDGEK